MSDNVLSDGDGTIFESGNDISIESDFDFSANSLNFDASQDWALGYAENNKPSGALLKDSRVDKALEDYLIVSDEGKSNNANLTVSPSQSSYKYGSDVRLNIRLFDNQTPLSGVVLVTVDSTEHRVNVTNGSAFLIISGLENNTYPVVAEFIGDDFYEAVTNDEATIVVNKSRAVTGNASVTEIARYGEDVVVSITNMADVDGKLISLYGGYQLVGPKTPYGSFYLKKGTGSFYFSNLPVGNYSVYVVFGNNIGGTYELPNFILNFTVVKAKANLAVDVDSIDYGDEVILNIDLKDNEGYGVEITDINDSLPVVELQFGDFNESVTLDMGQGSFNATDLPKGTYNAIAIFKETDFYEASTYEFSFKVGREDIDLDYSVELDSMIKSASDEYNDSLNFVLKDALGNPLSDKNITIIYDGENFTETTDSLGKVRLNLSLKNGLNEFMVSFAGDETYNSLSKDINFPVSRKTFDLAVINKVYKARAPKKVLRATFKLDDGKAIADKLVSFTVNNKTYSAKTDSKGQVSVRVNLTKKGTYEFTADFAGDDSYAPISKSGKIVLK